MHRLIQRPAWTALLVALSSLFAFATSSRAEEFAVPAWVPSLGFGAGIQARQVKGDIDALLFMSNDQPTRRVPCFPAGNELAGFCNYSTDDERSLDGAVIQGSAQLLGPSLKNVFLRPRPFVQGGFTWAFDSRTIAESGLPVSSFEDNSLEPDGRVRLRGNPDYFWHVGGGIALQLPIELRPVFLKIGGHYMEESTEVVGTIDRAQDTLASLQTTEFRDDLTIRGAGPDFGIEVEIARFGPLAINFSGDVLLSFPLSGQDTQFALDAPSFEINPPNCVDAPPGTVRCKNPAQFSYDADSVHWLGAATIRFAWVGRD